MSPRRIGSPGWLAGSGWILAGLFVAAASVEAQTETGRSVPEKTVVVLPPRCATSALQFASFIESLRVELAGQGLRCAVGDAQDGPSVGAAVQVELTIEPCDSSPALIAIRVSAPEGKRELHHEVTLADVAPTALSRTLALAVAELIRAAGRNNPTVKPAVATIARKSPAPPPRSAAASSAWLYSFFGGFELRSYPVRGNTLWGGRLAFAASNRDLHAELDLGGGVAVKRVELGRIFMQMASAGLTLGPRLARGNVIVDLGLRAELGWAWTDGEAFGPPGHGAGGSTFVANTGLRLSLEPFAGRTLHPRLDLEGGAVLRSLTAEVDGVPRAGISGAYILASIGLTFAPHRD